MPSSFHKNANISPSSIIPVLFAGKTSPLTLDEKVTRLWQLESIGIKDNPCQDDDHYAMDQFKNSIQMIYGRYHVKWPLRDPELKVPLHHGLARARFQNFYNYRLSKEPNLLQKYNEVILQQIQLGIIEEVPVEDMNTRPKLCSYIPHQAIF